MRRPALLTLLLAAPLLAQPKPVPTVPRLMQPEAVMALPAGKPAERIAYGEAPSQFAELWLPDAAKHGEGPWPVVAVLHGGCWQKQFADLSVMNPAATDLVARGYAVWNIEYRRIGEEGAGYPGTYADVNAALAKLAAEAPARKLDLSRVALLGHSAGGHLALWAAAREKLPKEHPLRPADMLPVKAVFSLGGLGDLKDYAAEVCGADVAAAMTGEKSDARADVFADTSPFEMLPFAAPVVMAQGIYDGVSYPELGRSFVFRAQTRGMKAQILLLPNAGHFEIMAPGTRAWETIVTELGTRLAAPK
ncbi:alpha/beta hydrolase family protein [Sandaracinobacteroides saxicola]|uniref:Alpha/beta hydrolase n=1 Tax=Sandaracinobacteroides saxicola TaxID=2759707 RepID=A0A7G5IJY6_9SPHN|nr:alpha/beta hydrolase [Sandaracinobacteroides saxicola]QMW23678.1 alpha/beta hydrolase [Sandaracinobacteroides saxicola]